jgi:hypothetical protein
MLPDPPARRPLPDLAPLQQSEVWAEALRRLGAEVVALGPDTGGHAVLRTLPLLGRTAMISRGGTGLSVAAAGGLRAALGARHLVIHAETERDGEALACAGFRRIAPPRRVAELDLDAPPEVLAARMSVKWRNRLRHALGQGLEVRRRPMPPDPRHWLFAAEAEAARRLRVRPMPPVLVAALCDVAPGTGQLFTVTRRGERLAAMLFLRHGDAATYQTGWTSAAGRALSAGNLCLWRAMVELRELGAVRIELGAADADLAPGLTRFKTGAGGVVRPLGGSWLRSAWLPGPRAPRFSRAIPPAPAPR